MQKLILTSVFMLVLTMLFFYPTPTNLLEKEHLLDKVEKASTNQIKDKNNITIKYSIQSKYCKNEQSKLVKQPLHEPLVP